MVIFKAQLNIQIAKYLKLILSVLIDDFFNTYVYLCNYYPELN